MAVTVAPTETATREALLAALAAAPGSTLADVARAVGLAHTTVTYHLRRLEKRSAVVSLRSGARLHFFLNGQAPARERSLLVARRLGRSGDVLARVPRDAPAALGPIADGLAMSKPGVVWHLRRLVALGLVEAEGPARARRYRALA